MRRELGMLLALIVLCIVLGRVHPLAIGYFVVFGLLFGWAMPWLAESRA